MRPEFRARGDDHYSTSGAAASFGGFFQVFSRSTSKDSMLSKVSSNFHCGYRYRFEFYRFQDSELVGSVGLISDQKPNQTARGDL